MATPIQPQRKPRRPASNSSEIEEMLNMEPSVDEAEKEGALLPSVPIELPSTDIFFSFTAGSKEKDELSSDR